MRNAAPLALIPVLAVATLAGCSSSGSTKTTTGQQSLPGIATSAPAATESVAPTDSPSATDSGASSPTASATASTTASGTASASPTAAGGSACPTSSLKVGLGQSQGAAGSEIVNVTFTNSSSSSCTLTGFPGVSFVTGDSGTQVGAAAQKDGASAGTVTLKSGDVASASVRIAQTANFPAATCKPVDVRGLRVYPPNQTAAVFVAMSGTACSSSTQQLFVKSVVAGSGS